MDGPIGSGLNLTLPPASEPGLHTLHQNVLIESALEVLDIGDELLDLVERASQGLMPSLLAIHGAIRWRRASSRLLRALNDLPEGEGRP